MKPRSIPSVVPAVYEHVVLGLIFLKYAFLVLMVARGGIEPPTRGFSVRIRKKSNSMIRL